MNKRNSQKKPKHRYISERYVNSTAPAYLTLIHPFEVNTSILSRGFSPDDLACKGCSHPGQGNVISCLFEESGAV